MRDTPSLKAQKPTLYLFIGYPGAGKTTVATMIAEATGAVHLWADYERHKMFAFPTHSRHESLQLYDELNQRTDELLTEGRSVVFDTNFNFYHDRQKMRHIAAKHGAETLVIWITLPEEVAKQRAVYSAAKRNGYDAEMTEAQFNAIIDKLEPPEKDEKIIKLDGTKLDRESLIALLGQ